MSAPKEGLQSALDFTKYALAIAGAAIAFLLSADTLKSVTSDASKWLVTGALVSFGVSAIGGILVLMQGASSLANAEYDLGHKYLRLPGLVNVFGLIFGFVFTTTFVIVMLWTNKTATDPNLLQLVAGRPH